MYEGWSLSYDKVNDCYKLQKRINGRVKSYSLPKRFNPFCKIIRENKELKEKVRELERKMNYLEYIILKLRNVMKYCIIFCPNRRKPTLLKLNEYNQFICPKCSKVFRYNLRLAKSLRLVSVQAKYMLISANRAISASITPTLKILCNFPFFCLQ